MKNILSVIQSAWKEVYSELPKGTITEIKELTLYKYWLPHLSISDFDFSIQFNKSPLDYEIYSYSYQYFDLRNISMSQEEFLKDFKYLKSFEEAENEFSDGYEYKLYFDSNCLKDFCEEHKQTMSLYEELEKKLKQYENWDYSNIEDILKTLREVKETRYCQHEEFGVPLLEWDDELVAKVICDEINLFEKKMDEYSNKYVEYLKENEKEKIQSIEKLVEVADEVRNKEFIIFDNSKNTIAPDLVSLISVLFKQYFPHLSDTNVFIKYGKLIKWEYWSFEYENFFRRFFIRCIQDFLDVMGLWYVLYSLSERFVVVDSIWLYNVTLDLDYLYLDERNDETQDTNHITRILKKIVTTKNKEQIQDFLSSIDSKINEISLIKRIFTKSIFETPEFKDLQTGMYQFIKKWLIKEGFFSEENLEKELDAVSKYFNIDVSNIKRHWLGN